MLPSIFLECHPISNIEDIDSVIQEPPVWIERLKPLVPRSEVVVRNEITDCHSAYESFVANQRLDRKLVPKTLVCHDYKGGYQADKYLNFENEDILGDGYTFYNWAQIDYFVYFSHHLITIPPLSWTNIGHENGVKVLGTLITEFTPGAKLCDEKIFKNIESMQKFAKNLVEITKLFGFDGWLLNIENEVQNIDILKEFVQYFTSLLHFDNQEYVVIWYDSVTNTGELKWQDELNDSNRFFFDACDGIFLNYCWDEQKLKNSVKAAGHRVLEVFVGIDIFGRNMLGGGQFNTYKAAELVAKHKLSAAYFAPGWTHETLSRDNQDEFFKKFLSRDHALWSSLWPFLYTHPINTYFSTNFYIGLDKRFYNLFNQNRQLSRLAYPELPTEVENFEEITTLKEKCSCVRSVVAKNSKNTFYLTKRHLKVNEEYVHRLFQCDLEISRNTIVYFFTRIADINEIPTKLSLTMLTWYPSGCFKKIKFLNVFKLTPINNVGLLEVNPATSVDLLEHVKRKHTSLAQEDDVTISAYLFHTPACKILEIAATIEGGHSIFLSAFGIEDADKTFLRSRFVEQTLNAIL